MIAIHLAVLAAVALWVIRRPFSELRPVFICWWAGIVLFRVVPLAILTGGGLDTFQESGLTSAVEVMSLAGALLLYRAVLALLLWERPRSWWFKIAAGLFVLGQLLGAVTLAGAPVVAIMCLPLIPAFRWRSGLKAAGILQATLAFAMTAVLVVIEMQSSTDGLIQEAADRIGAMVAPVVLVYSFLGIFVLGRRLHLSIRRIRSRLLVSHLLISVVPVGLTALFLLLSGTLFVSTYRGQIMARQLQKDANGAVEQIAAAMDATGVVPLNPFGSTVTGQAVLIEDRPEVRILTGTPPTLQWTHIFDHDIPSSDAPLLWDGNSLFIRGRWEGIAPDGDTIRVEALCLLDSLRMASFSDFLGTPAWVDPLLYVERTGTGISVSGAGDPRHNKGNEEDVSVVQSIRSDRDVETEPGQSMEAQKEHFHIQAEDHKTSSWKVDSSTLGRWRLPGGAVVSVLSWDEGSGGWRTTNMPVISSAGFGEQIGSLFAKTDENPLATAVLLVLGILALVLAITVWITGAMVSEMIRSITRSVRALTTATLAIGRGDLSHRIVLETQDELWDVADSFNRMSEDLSRMQAVELERQRLEEDLRLAREIQDRLLPSGPPKVPHLDLAGVSVPAREVGGDYYDFITLPDGKVVLVVADVSGKGTPAAMLMSAFRAAIRSQDLTLSGPADVLGRVNGFIHSSVDPGRFITAFIAVLDPGSGVMRYANAGHDSPVLLGPDGTMRELAGGGLILGMLPKIVYEDTTAILDKGSVMLVYTDGVTEARDGNGEFFGIDRLQGGFVDAVDGSASEILDVLMKDLRDFRGETAQSDDITMVLARMV